VLPAALVLVREGKTGVMVDDDGKARGARSPWACAGARALAVTERLVARRCRREPGTASRAAARRAEDHAQMNLAVRDIRHSLGRFV
jgi:hypothetical protein